MTLLISPETTDTRAEEPAPGCGCCIPPPDTVDRRMAELLARRDRLDGKLQRLR